ncbi:hypothetical protein VOLCADRAFT_94364 [Volvox carteri f. nagariensis]|uniref:Uncharacterized protein n=1 Tax=Volvox carteri f. nagariensis TaxID=3068 RepID=D8U4L2_VOLCA|nr:uncharacterized protein VOLCADRAFT_94364 [Volvox carteri f. nagariensis]EFJ45293.1 hypothetical protein VOLCADRAFT_94364 [Volvox carteri f. nagariensis]|eukprot:XP_002953669.1 hypothetical protein VOLCADRAFT_94364 [Volvox carteri f. nagariensis]
MLLLPIAWPWLLLRCAQMMLSVACLLAAAAADGLIFLAELLRRNRGSVEVLSSWASGSLGWVVARYWAGLGQLHMVRGAQKGWENVVLLEGFEEALGRLSQLLTPLLAAAISSSPVAARLFRMISPLLAVVAKVQAAVYGMYCFVHDEIVPVALDLAERLPLVHGLLHRAVEGGSA